MFLVFIPHKSVVPLPLGELESTLIIQLFHFSALELLDAVFSWDFRGMEILGSSSVSNEIFGIIFMVIGIAIVALAITNPRKILSKFYDAHPKSKVSLMGVSWSPNSFRVWVGIMGCLSVALGIAALVLPAHIGAGS
jgi:hypothetical protein